MIGLLKGAFWRFLRTKRSFSLIEVRNFTDKLCGFCGKMAHLRLLDVYFVSKNVGNA